MGEVKGALLGRYAFAWPSESFLDQSTDGGTRDLGTSASFEGSVREVVGRAGYSQAFVASTTGT